MTTPKHLIHIGFPKAGSTFLQEWFAKHPKFHFRNAGFGGYHNLHEFIRDATRLEINQYDYLVTSSESIVAANAYAGVQNTNYGSKYYAFARTGSRENLCHTLSDLYPNSKILIITRGFKSVIKSGYAQYLKAGGVQSLNQIQTQSQYELKRIAERLDFSDNESVIQSILNHEIYTHSAVNQQPQLQQMIANLHKKYSSFFYDESIKLYQRKFGIENVIIMPYELLKIDQKRFLEEVQKLLDITPIDIDMGVVNPSLSLQELFWRRKISRIISRIGHIFGQKVYRLIYGLYMQQLQTDNLNFIFKSLKRIFPNKIIEAYEIPEEELIWYRNQANLLKDNPLYQPYAEEYLWT